MQCRVKGVAVSEAIPDIDMSQFLDLFIDEGKEYIQALNQCLLTLERTPDDADALEALFRSVHSLKGISATMRYDTLATLAHAAEDILHKVRDGEWTLSPELIEILFAAVDVFQSLVDDVAAGGTGEGDVTAIVERLQGYEPRAEAPTGSQQTAEAERSSPTQHLRSPATTVIRVDVHHLDTLLDVVTEMVIHRSLLDRLAERHNLNLAPLSEAIEVYNRLLAQLQDTVLTMRMVPVGQVFGRFPRMVRDLLKTLGKEARLVIEGEDVELDRAALEALNDPLVHLLRNAIDHGLETPAEREAAGKPPQGTLRLSAQRERDTVLIEVGDDGRGMDVRRIAAAAVERGIVPAEAVEEMGEGQILALICHPGFSLSERVTTVSGRGVGMNVVKQQLEALRGALQIDTRLGHGSTFRLQLPAMIALVQGVIVRVSDEQYVLPAHYVKHVIEFDPSEIEHVGTQELIRHEGGLLPLRQLGELLGTAEAAPPPRHVLVVQHDGQTLGLKVDDVLGHEEIVVKPLPEALSGTPGLAGVTILGEGRVVLILDVTEL
jgi:two-component system chemotaxis sensor kinase CheA